MNRNVVLTILSLLSIFLLSLHLTDDIVYGSERSMASNIIVLAILIVWLYGALALVGRSSGYVIMLLGSLAGLLVFTVHVNRAGGLAGTLAASSGAFFFVWTLLALGATSVVSAILSVQGLWELRRSNAPRSAPTSFRP